MEGLHEFSVVDTLLYKLHAFSKFILYMGTHLSMYLSIYPSNFNMICLLLFNTIVEKFNLSQLIMPISHRFQVTCPNTFKKLCNKAFK